VAQVGIILSSDWWWRNTNKQDANVTTRIRNFVGEQGVFNFRRPAVKALMARRNALL
jgi:hypothetical protein